MVIYINFCEYLIFLALQSTFFKMVSSAFAVGLLYKIMAKQTDLCGIQSEGTTKKERGSGEQAG